MPDSADEAEKIEKAATAPAVAANEQARQAWRGWVIPAVGSMAFFSSMDWLLMSLPVVVVVVALSDIFLNGESYD